MYKITILLLCLLIMIGGQLNASSPYQISLQNDGILLGGGGIVF